MTLGLCSQRELDAVVKAAAKKAGLENAVSDPAVEASDKARLIEELRRERDDNEKAAAEAAQEAEAAAWLQAKRASEEEQLSGMPVGTASAAPAEPEAEAAPAETPAEADDAEEQTEE